MTRMVSNGVAATLALAVLSFGGAAMAAEGLSRTEPVEVSVLPVRYAYVNGDHGKFRAHHWMKDGYSGGVTKFSTALEGYDGISVVMHGSGLSADSEYDGEIEIAKEDLGFFKITYQEFNKYFDTTGGFYERFKTLPYVDTDKELILTMGKLEIEAGLRIADWPELTFIYEHEYKNGTKSRLTWAGVVEGTQVAGNANNRTRKIAPSWQEIDEEVNLFELKAEKEWKGFNFVGEQDWEIVHSVSNRNETQYSTTPPAGADRSNTDQKIREQKLNLKSVLLTTLLGVDKWFMEDTLYLSSKYRFSQTDAHEIENIYEMDQFMVPTNFSTNAEQVRDSLSGLLYKTNTWVEHAHWRPLQDFVVDAKFKVENATRESWSNYNKDKFPFNADGSSEPDGVIDQTDVSENLDKIRRYGESVSLRYTGIPFVALYSDLQFEQVRNELTEDRQSRNTAEQVNREVIPHQRRMAITVGTRMAPLPRLTLAANARHREDDTTYNNVHYHNVGGAKSTFVDGQFIETNEVEARIAWKPVKWFAPGFRYKLQDIAYDSWGLPNSDIHMGAGVLSNFYIWDIVSQPTDDLLLTGAFSIQDAQTNTPARWSVRTVQFPIFNADVAMLLLSAEYTVREDLTLTGVYQGSRANNFTDFSDLTLAYGQDYRQNDVTIGLRWTPKENMWVAPKYAYYNFLPGDKSDVGNYNAHVLWLEFHTEWK